jgi:hypothetical protein
MSDLVQILLTVIHFVFNHIFLGFFYFLSQYFIDHDFVNLSGQEFEIFDYVSLHLFFFRFFFTVDF